MTTLMEVHFGLFIRWRAKRKGGVLWKGLGSPGDMGFSCEVQSTLLWLLAKLGSCQQFPKPFSSQELICSSSNPVE